MTMREPAFVALGSNLGDREQLLAAARDGLARLPETTFEAASSIEETEPIGPVPQGHFLNQMVLLWTELPPRVLFDHCLTLERAAGREREERWGPRTLDLDLVKYGDRVIREPGIVVPHPELPHREFWKRELAELEPRLQRRPTDAED
jgi:2-amino-4-hydroxy-6-hydroxymethyldihydropteridine diphosphokinase